MTMDPQLLLIPSPATEFVFDSTSTSPFTTAPSSPKILFPKFFNSTLTSHQPIHKNLDYFQETEQTDFAFDFSGQLDRPSISDADDLFDAGKIKPLEPPQPPTPKLLPMNIVKPFVHRTKNDQIKNKTLDDKKLQVSTTQSSQFGFLWYNKWNLKNLLLFRSTSEGSATTIKDDQSNKLDAAIRRDVNSLSFRSCDGGGSVSRRRKMKRKVSAHEIHYTANRAVAEEMRRKTFLPYKSGLLGCLGFSKTVHESFRGVR